MAHSSGSGFDMTLDRESHESRLTFVVTDSSYSAGCDINHVFACACQLWIIAGSMALPSGSTLYLRPLLACSRVIVLLITLSCQESFRGRRIAAYVTAWECVSWMKHTGIASLPAGYSCSLLHVCMWHN